MSFRRSKASAEQARMWKQFLVENQDLLICTGIPLSVFEHHHMFDDLLMHGYIDHHVDPTRFSVKELDAKQKECLVQTIVNYLRSGFNDPGLGIFGHDMHEEIRRRAKEGKQNS